MRISISTVAIVLLASSACATSGPKTPNRAAVVMKISETEGHVCMGMGEVKAGDHVSLFKSECTKSAPSPKGHSTSSCKRVNVGEGTVVRALNEHYSVIRVDPGVQFVEGTMVEKTM